MKVLKCNDNTQYFIISSFYELDHINLHIRSLRDGKKKHAHVCRETCGGTLASLNFPKMAKGKNNTRLLRHLHNIAI
jgi:hypothetical protein